MSSEDFWNLTWFDWGLLLLKVVRDREKEKVKEESEWHKWRVMVADFRNAHFRGKGDPAFIPQDLVPLSFDKEIKKEEVQKVSFKEMKAQLGSKFKHGI